MLKNFIIDSEKTIKEAMTKINKNLTGTIFINKNKKIIGVVTDGDIRRFLLSGYNINNKIKIVANKNYISIPQNSAKEVIFSICQKYKNKIKVFPVINKTNEVVDIIIGNRLNFIPIYEPFLTGNENKYLTECLNSNWISSGGPFVEKFENKFSKIHNNTKALTVSSATTGLHLALMSLGIKKNDEVIVPNLTFAAVINSVLYANAKPIIVDVDKDKWTIDVEDIKKKITKKTKAIIVVHLYGNPCNMNEIIKICSKYKIFLIEDCAEAIGSRYKKKIVGTFGDCSVFSFFGNKTITTGEGGMILFRNPNFYNLAKKLRDHGMSLQKKYYHDLVGYNYRMTNMQAAIGLAQLEKFDKIISRKIEIFNVYKKFLGKLNYFKFQKNEQKCLNTYWAIAVKINHKNFKFIECEEFMKNNGIEIRNLFYPLNQQKIYKKYSFKKKYNTDIFCSKAITLPTFPAIKNKEIAYVANTLKKYVKNISLI
jgi:perosamine synthetase